MRIEEKQADALVNAFAEDIGANLATKDDSAALLQEMALREERLNARMDRMTARFTVLTLGLAGLMLTAIGIATGVIVAILG